MQRDLSARLESLERELAAIREDLASSRGAEGGGVGWRSRMRFLLVAAGVLGIAVTGVATGATGDPLKEGSRNPATGFASAETKLLSQNAAGYTARLANNQAGDGGALISTCRSTIANEPCFFGANTTTGRAFQFLSGGTEVGRIESTVANAKPFTTNATGVATGLNADKVDGQDASALLGARAYAYVNQGTTPSFNAAKTKGFTSVNYSGAAGGYCLTPAAGIDPATSVLTASADFGSTALPDPDAHYHVGFNCGSGQFQVVTTAGGTPSNSVSFTVAVP